MPRKLEMMPVDAHSLLSLCAPRPVFMNCGNQSSWTDPYGIYLTAVGATPVYELLGHRGLLMEDPKPRLEVGYIGGDIGYRYHDGGHTDQPDWPDFWNFARKYVDVPTLYFSSGQLAFESRAGGTGTFIIESDTRWSLTCGDPWVRISKSEGMHSDTVRVALTEANPGPEARSARITVSAGGLKDQYVMINQGSPDPSFSGHIHEPVIDDADNSFTTLRITSNTAWNIETSPAWLTAEPSGGINNAETKLIAGGNESVEPRQAKVIVSSPELEDQVLERTQEGADPRLDLRGSDFQPIAEIALPAGEGGSATVFALTNTSAEFSSSEAWLTLSVRHNPRWQFYSVTLTAERNNGLEERRAIVTARVSGLEPRFIAVIQAAGPPVAPGTAAASLAIGKPGCSGPTGTAGPCTYPIPKTYIYVH